MIKPGRYAIVPLVIVLTLSGIWLPIHIPIAHAGSVGTFTPCVNGFQVDINGGASPGSSVTFISWSWGDGSTTNSFFPASHTYSNAGPYSITVTAHYNDGSSASASTAATVGPGILSNCESLVISSGLGGSVSYTASVGSGTVQPGSSATLYLDFADDLNLIATPSDGGSFNSWSVSGSITGPNSSPVPTSSPSVLIVVGGSGGIGASFGNTGNPNLFVTSVSANTLNIGNPSTITITVKNAGSAMSQSQTVAVTLDFYNDPSRTGGLLESLLQGVPRLIEHDPQSGSTLTVFVPAIAPGSTAQVQVTVSPSLYDAPSFVFTNYMIATLAGIGISSSSIDAKTQVSLDGASLTCGVGIIEDYVLKALVVGKLLNYVPKGAFAASEAMGAFVEFVSKNLKLGQFVTNHASDFIDLLAHILDALYNTSQGGAFWQELASGLWNFVGGNVIFSCAQVLLGSINYPTLIGSILYHFVYNLWQQGTIALQDGISFLKTLLGSLKAWIIILSEPFNQHDLNLVVSALQGETGLLSNGTIVSSIIGSDYMKIPPGVQAVVTKQTVPFEINIGASNAQQALEEFNLTIIYSTGLNQTTLKMVSGEIIKGQTSTFSVNPSSNGFDLTGISVSAFSTDPSQIPLPLDSSGNASVYVVLSNGKVRSANPGQLLAWVNVTNIGGAPLQSISLNETLPTDWTVHPNWLPSMGGIAVFFVFSNGTRLDITNMTLITVSTGNPERISISISNMTATLAGQALGPGESILLGAKLSYALIGTSQSFTSYPRTYNDTSIAAAWMQASFSGGQTSATASSFFKAYAKVNGDVDGDGVVNILDLALVGYAFGARPGDSRWNPALDVMNHGVIDITDLAYVASCYGNHA